MQSGTPLDQFTDFVVATDPAYISGPEEIANIATTYRTYYWSRILTGKHPSRFLQGGSKIRDKAIFRHNNTAEFYLPTQPWEYRIPNLLASFEVRWAFLRDYMAWSKQEIELHEGIRYATGDNLYRIFASLKKDKEMGMWVSKWEKMEQALFAPGTAAMEDPDGVVPYSMPFFINEFANGLFGTGVAGYDAPTTVETLSPTSQKVNGRWDHQRLQYLTKTGDQGLLSMMDKMMMLIDWEAVDTYDQYWTTPQLNHQIILTTMEGMLAYKERVRIDQDLWVAADRTDSGVTNPVNYGIPIKYCAVLDSAALYANAANNALVTEEFANNIGPRFYYWNANDLFPVMHSTVFCEKQRLQNPSQQPDMFAQPVFTWYNLIDRNRRHHGLLSPGADLYYGSI